MNQGQLNNMDKRQMSEEELQRTQVLNLEDFRDVARIERISSKKPAIIVAMIGILSILIGSSFPAYQSYTARKEAEKERQIAARKKEEEERKKAEIEKDVLVCNYETTSEPRNVIERLKSTYTFENNKLKKLVKEHTIVRLHPEQESPFLDEFKGIFPQYLVNSPGYTITIREVENGQLDTVKIDYESLDKSIIPEFDMNNYRFTTEFDKDISKEEVIADRTAKSFKCE